MKTLLCRFANKGPVQSTEGHREGHISPSTSLVDVITESVQINHCFTHVFLLKSTV